MTPFERTSTFSLRQEFLEWRWGMVNLGWILLAHIALAGVFAVGYTLLPIAIYLPIALVASLLHQKTMSEWIHEAAHFNLLPNRRANDLVVTGLCGIFLGNSVTGYRAGHFRHHAKSSFFEADDPDTNFSFVRNRRDLWVGVAADLTGVNAVRGYLKLYVLPRFRPTNGRPSQAHAAVGFFLVLTILHLAVLTFLLSVGRLDAYIIYYASILTLYPLFNRIRAYGQHVELCADGTPRFLGSSISRTIDAGLIDRIFFTSRIMMYHHEHHAWPTLPFRACRLLAERSTSRIHTDFNIYCVSRLNLLRRIFVGLPATAN